MIESSLKSPASFEQPSGSNNDGKHIPFQFSLRSLLLAAVLVAVFFGYGISRGFGPATVLLCLSFVLALFWHFRLRHWKSIGFWTLAIAILEVVFFAGLAACIMVNVEIDPAIVGGRIAQNLRSAFDGDQRFEKMNVGYFTKGDLGIMSIDGQVQTEGDLNALRELLRMKIGKATLHLSVRVDVIDSGRVYNLTDEQIWK